MPFVYILRNVDLMPAAVI